MAQEKGMKEFWERYDQIGRDLKHKSLNEILKPINNHGTESDNNQ